MSRGLLLYDADCGFCAATARRVPLLRLPVRIASIQETDLSAYGVDARRAETEMPFVAADGHVTYGHRAWAEALRSGGPLLRLVGALLGSRLVDPLASRTYRWVAEHRHRLPGGTAACELPSPPPQER